MKKKKPEQVYIDANFSRNKKKCKVFANRYYYEGSHGIVSLLFSSAHLFNLPASNKQIGSHYYEREKFSYWFIAFFFYTRDVVCVLFSLVWLGFFSLLFSLYYNKRERAYIRFALTVVRQAFLHAKKTE